MADKISANRDGAVVRVVLNRPEVRNALDQEVIEHMTAVFERLSEDHTIRAIVLSGEGKAFCGGADVNYMRMALDWNQEQNVSDALHLANMFGAIDKCTAPVIAKVHGAALGGGAGLVATCDIAVAADDAIFGFTEAKLGIVPAVISPFVIRKIGPSHARALFLTAERFSAERALRIGLVHDVIPADQLGARVEAKVAELLSSGPQAARTAKEIVQTVPGMDRDDARRWTAKRTAERRQSPEGQEGLRAFLDKRKPNWQ